MNHPVFICCVGRERSFGEGITPKLRHGTWVHPTLEKTVFHGVLYQPSSFWRRRVLSQLGGVCEELHYLMDAELWIRYLLKHGQSKVELVDDLLVDFRFHSDSKTVSRKHRFDLERWRLRSKLLEQLGASSLLMEQAVHLSGGAEVPNWQVEVALDIDAIEDLCTRDLFRTFYERSDYRRARLMFREACARSVWANSRAKLTYFIKLFLIPKRALQFLRLSHRTLKPLLRSQY